MTDDPAARYQPDAMSHPGAATDFVPADVDATDWSQIEPLFNDLIDRPVNSPAEFESWLLHRSELDAACSEARAMLYITMSCHTDDKEANDAYTTYIENIPPRAKPLSFKLNQKHSDLARQFPLDENRYEVINRNTCRTVELFRDENVPLETELAKLSQRYDQIAGAMTVEFNGTEHTMPQMNLFVHEDDRKVRESAWRAIANRRLVDRDRIDDLYEEMIRRRHQIAINAGYDNYRDYKHAEFCRFDYSARDCFQFHAAVEEHCVPFARDLHARRKERLNVEPLRPWDLLVDELGRPPLKPFSNGQELIEKSRRVFDRLSPELGAMFGELGDNETPGGCLDLDTRKGKAPGGYQYMRDRSRRPFIFMNAAGLHRDVETMVHEAGHAFHSQFCRDEPLVDYRHSPIEFAEVASMTMELLTMPYWDEFYPDASSANRARRQQLESSISLLPWIASIDAFQHWIYTNPTHARSDRYDHWLELDERFGAAVSWSGLEEERAVSWQRQGHLFGVPFYYIEYGIAQLGALGLWRISLDQGEAAAIDLYKRALSLGGSRPLPELFESAGVPFDFGPSQVARLVEAVRTELDRLPD